MFSHRIPLPTLSNFPLTLSAALQPSSVVQKAEEVPRLSSSSSSVFFIRLSFCQSGRALPLLNRGQEGTYFPPQHKLHGGQISALHVKLLMKRPLPLLFSPPRLRAEGRREKTEISEDSLCISTRRSETAGTGGFTWPLHDNTHPHIHSIYCRTSTLHG